MIFSQTQLKKDYKACEKVIAKNSITFFSAFKHLQPIDANAVYAVYTFCRIVDDFADVDHSIDKVIAFEHAFRQFLEVDNTSTFYWRALKDVFQRYEMNADAFFAQIDGQKFDLNGGQINDEADLANYCYLVAGSVGLMLMPILCKEISEETKEISLLLGEAMQITNILRDIGTDLHIHRRYIPTTLMMQYQYSLDHLENQVINHEFISLVEYLMQKAEAMYLTVEARIHLYKTEAQYAILLALYYYRAIINKIRENQYDVFSLRAVVNSKEKLAIAKTVKNKLNKK